MNVKVEADQRASPVPFKQLGLFLRGDRRPQLDSKRVTLNLCCISFNVIAKGWDAFELIEIKGREESGGCTSESEAKDAEALNYAAAAAAAKSLQSGALCNPIDGSPPGSSVPGILQARTWHLKI